MAVNIFVTDLNPENCASYLDDKRVVKMVLESAQLLSTAISVYGGQAPYKPNHVNHPCSKWVRETNNNYNWLLHHFKALCEEYTKRYKKVHKCQAFLLEFKNGIQYIPTGELTSFPNCTTFKEISDTYQAYKLYLNEKWKNDKRVPTWSGYTREQIECLGLV